MGEEMFVKSLCCFTFSWEMILLSNKHFKKDSPKMTPILPRDIWQFVDFYGLLLSILGDFMCTECYFYNFANFWLILNHFNCNLITEKLWHILMKSLDFSICILYKYTSLESLELSKEMLLANITFVVDWDLLSGWLECCDNSPRRRDWYCPLFSYIFPSPIHIRKYGNYSQILK